MRRYGYSCIHEKKIELISIISMYGIGQTGWCENNNFHPLGNNVFLIRSAWVQDWMPLPWTIESSPSVIVSLVDNFGIEYWVANLTNNQRDALYLVVSEQFPWVSKERIISILDMFSV
jgi:hypothetical protein